jgi:hypothetical protein
LPLDRSTFVGGFNEYAQAMFVREMHIHCWYGRTLALATTTACDFSNVEFHNALIAGFKHHIVLALIRSVFVVRGSLGS